MQAVCYLRGMLSSRELQGSQREFREEVIILRFYSLGFTAKNVCEYM